MRPKVTKITAQWGYMHGSLWIGFDSWSDAISGAIKHLTQKG